MNTDIKDKGINTNGKKATGDNDFQMPGRDEILRDYVIINRSRQASILGRKEALIGRANFGIFGDGKELAQVAMAKTFRNGDFRSGYYRDQTFMFAAGMSNIKQFFAQLYGDTDLKNEPNCAGRNMNCHYASRLLDENGKWKNLMNSKNSSSDIAQTSGQMQRLLGLAYASKLYRNNPDLSYLKEFSNGGNEVAFGTIGNASTAEGPFWETINAAGVLMVPLAVSIWDDGFGISVPNIYQMTKSNISEILSGFEYSEELEQGFLIYRVPGWDYEALIKAYQKGIKEVREKHIPAIFHIYEVTQPLGHSTSGSHERYKTKERLQWEKDFDCIVRFRQWILEKEVATAEELDKIESDAKTYVKQQQTEAWDDFLNPIKAERAEASQLILSLAEVSSKKDELIQVQKNLMNALEITKREVAANLHDALIVSANESSQERDALRNFYNSYIKESTDLYGSHLYSQSDESPLNVEEVKPIYSEKSKRVDGREVLLSFFDHAFARDPRIFAIGEDIGLLGDVNQGLAGLQAKYGDIRITDTGIRETTILGQGIGAALRGLRPIVEVQYLDYLNYALQIITDDLATLRYRTAGGQKAPVIIRTRGHRLVGIFHSGSPLGMLTNAFRGLHVCVPRNMTQAAGFYNTLLKGDDPGLVIERLNAYRIKEILPDNVADITVPLGVPEVLTDGNDVTVITYGACVDIAKSAIDKLSGLGISSELIDVRTLLPFDIAGVILNSLKKTNRIVFVDEDVPGGATAYMMQQVLEEQGGYRYLDSQPVTVTAKAHRPAYGNDGDYFSKPNAEEIFEAIYKVMNESAPTKYPPIV